MKRIDLPAVYMRGGTSKVVVIGPSARAGCDVDYLFGAVSIDTPLIDWSGNCGNLSAAVGPFAISEELVPAIEGVTCVRIWQANLGERIDAYVPVRDGRVVEAGPFMEDGVPFAAAEILREPRLLDVAERVRALAAVRMGLAATMEEATVRRPATPKLAWVARPAAYRTAAGVQVPEEAVDVLARIVSMGKPHHAFTGTGSIALAVAAALPGSVVAEVARTLPGVPTRIGHASGVLPVGARLSRTASGWRVDKAVLSRSARRLMSGTVHVPG